MWSTVSKTFGKSTNTASQRFPRSMLLRTSSSKLNRAVTVECFGRKPNCLSVSNWPCSGNHKVESEQLFREFCLELAKLKSGGSWMSQSGHLIWTELLPWNISIFQETYLCKSIDLLIRWVTKISRGCTFQLILIHWFCPNQRIHLFLSNKENRPGLL